MTAGPDPAQPPAPGMSRRALRSGLEILVYFIGGAAVGGGAAYFGLNLLPGVGLLAIGVFFLAMWPNLILHEAGHGLAAMARGMQLVAFGIGPLRLERGSQGRWRLRNGGGVRGMGGFAAAFPRAGREPTRFDEAVVLAGGPLANLVTAALCLWLAAGLGEVPRAAEVATGFGLSALVLGVLNLVPITSAGWRSDGRGLLDLLRGSPHAALQQQVNRMGALSMAGVRPRLWPAAIVPEGPADDSSPLLAAGADAMRLSHAMDTGDAEAAGRAADDLARRYPELPEAMQPAIAVGLAGYAALIARDAGQLRSWRERSEGRSLLDLTPYLRWLDAELAMAEGDAEAAAAAVQAARATLDRVPDPVGVLLLGEYLDALQARLADGGAVMDGDATASL